MGVGGGGVRVAEHKLLQKDFEGLSSVFASCLIMRRAVAADYGGKRWACQNRPHPHVSLLSSFQFNVIFYGRIWI